MEAIGHLTGGIAHDFNNLLMAVLGSLELVRKRMPGDEKLAALVDNAILGAKRGATLTKRMLAFATTTRIELRNNPFSGTCARNDRAAGALAGTVQFDRDPFSARAQAYPCGRKPSGNGAAESCRQRARCHARGRSDHPGSARCGHSNRRARRLESGPLCLHQRERHR